ncbi:MAG TPA: alpha/beta hydrolase [Baekduia sp.]|nr:alpha/beta hydrolase [Baekduia sp.]
MRGLATTYRRAGSGPTVVYLHGMDLTQRWLPFHQSLSQRVDLIAPEQPGFGDTPMPQWLRSIDDVVLHLDDLFETLGLDDLHLVGFSLGGWIAAAFAVAYPRRLTSLTLAAPFGLRVVDSPPYDVFRMTPEESDDVLFNGHRDEVITDDPEADRVETFVHSYLELTAAARLAWNPRYDHRFDRRLERVACPALVIAAQDDHVLPREHCERWAELLPSGRLTVLEGRSAPTGHMMVALEPKRLADLIADFVTAEEAQQ